jgi:hypothetical protein
VTTAQRAGDHRRVGYGRQSLRARPGGPPPSLEHNGHPLAPQSSLRPRLLIPCSRLRHLDGQASRAPAGGVLCLHSRQYRRPTSSILRRVIPVLVTGADCTLATGAPPLLECTGGCVSSSRTRAAHFCLPCQMVCLGGSPSWLGKLHLSSKHEKGDAEGPSHEG